MRSALEEEDCDETQHLSKQHAINGNATNGILEEGSPSKHVDWVHPLISCPCVYRKHAHPLNYKQAQANKHTHPVLKCLVGKWADMLCIFTVQLFSGCDIFLNAILYNITWLILHDLYPEWLDRKSILRYIKIKQSHLRNTIDISADSYLLSMSQDPLVWVLSRFFIYYWT